MDTIITAIIAFASTNIDDIFLLMLFFGQERFSRSEVIAGQYLGIGFLIIISLLGALVGLLIEPAYVGLLGFVPIFFGIKGLMKLTRERTDSEPTISTDIRKGNNILAISFITIANGGDNIGIYVPLFSTLDVTEKVIVVGVFLILVGVWCFVASYLVRHPLGANTIKKISPVLSPIVFLLLGIYILVENGSLELLKFW